jgi:DNA (cytosine-5)-methyltransferase 1
MNGLALFAGVGGLELGLKIILPDLKTVCHVEGEIYNAELIKRKIETGKLDPGLIFSDVKSFGEVAHLFNRKVDWLSGGFPCQPFSNAGDRKGTNDERWVWDSIVKIISKARPNFLFFENVSNLINDRRAFDQICFTLSKIGFDIEWSALRASDVGANHQRNRLFIFGYRKEALKFINPKIPDSYGQRRNKEFKDLWSGKFNVIRGDNDADSNGKRCDQLDYATQSIEEKRQPHKSNNQTRNVRGYDSPEWWENEPTVRRVVDGVAFGAYRIRACGNGVVPLQAALAYYHLIQRAKKINGVA